MLKHVKDCLASLLLRAKDSETGFSSETSIPAATEYPKLLQTAFMRKQIVISSTKATGEHPAGEILLHMKLSESRHTTSSSGLPPWCKIEYTLVQAAFHLFLSKIILNIAGNMYNFKWHYSTSEEPYNIDVVSSDAGFAVIN